MDEDETLEVGAAGSRALPTDETAPFRDYVAHFLVPDPEMRHGWRDIWLKREKPGSSRARWRPFGRE